MAWGRAVVCYEVCVVESVRSQCDTGPTQEVGFGEVRGSDLCLRTGEGSRRELAHEITEENLEIKERGERGLSVADEREN